MPNTYSKCCQQSNCAVGCSVVPHEQNQLFHFLTCISNNTIMMVMNGWQLMLHHMIELCYNLSVLKLTILLHLSVTWLNPSFAPWYIIIVKVIIHILVKLTIINLSLSPLELMGVSGKWVLAVILPSETNLLATSYIDGNVGERGIAPLSQQAVKQAVGPVGWVTAGDGNGSCQPQNRTLWPIACCPPLYSATSVWVAELGSTWNNYPRFNHLCGKMINYPYVQEN